MVRLKTGTLVFIPPMLVLLLASCGDVGLKQQIIESVVPKKPTGLVATPLAQDQVSAVRLDWTNNDADVNKLLVERSGVSSNSGFSTIAELPKTAITYLDQQGLQGDTEYWYRVGAVNDVGPSFSTTVFVRTFPLMTDSAAVSADHASLLIVYSSGDSSSSVTKNLTLPILGTNGSTISWASNSAAIDVSATSATGTALVTGQASSDAQVTLTATVSRGSSNLQKTFNLTVKASNTGAIAADKLDLAITYAAGDNASSVTQNLTLPTTGTNGSSIVWASNNPAISTTAVVGTGMVVRQLVDTPVTLTATITFGLDSDTKQFNLVVFQSDAGAVAEAKAALTIGYASGDSASHVTQNLTLPTTGLKGTTIGWASTNTELVSTSGEVTPPTGPGVAMILTATISKGGASDTKAFNLTVMTGTLKLFYLDGGTWSAHANPPASTVAVSEQGSTLYAIDFGGTTYGWDAGWHALPAAQLTNPLSISSWGSTLWTLTGDRKLYYLDGASWKLASTLAPVNAVCIAGSDTALFALAGASVYHLDGGSWQSMGAPLNPISIAVSDGILYVLTDSGEIHYYDGGWNPQIPGLAPTGYAGIGGGTSMLYILSYQ